MTLPADLRRQTAISKTCKARSVVIRDSAAAHCDLMHRVPLELVAVVARPRLNFLASRLGVKRQESRGTSRSTRAGALASISRHATRGPLTSLVSLLTAPLSARNPLPVGHLLAKPMRTMGRWPGARHALICFW